MNNLNVEILADKLYLLQGMNKEKKTPIYEDSNYIYYNEHHINW